MMIFMQRAHAHRPTDPRTASTSRSAFVCLCLLEMTLRSHWTPHSLFSAEGVRYVFTLRYVLVHPLSFFQLTRVQDLTGFQLVFYHTLIKTSFIHSFIRVTLRNAHSYLQNSRECCRTYSMKCKNATRDVPATSKSQFFSHSSLLLLVIPLATKINLRVNYITSAIM